MPKLLIASDHAGYGLKQALIPYIGSLGYEVEDMGAHELAPEDDYPDYVSPLAARIAMDPLGRGVIIGKSGQGEAMCANRLKSVRAAVYYGGEVEVVRLERAHNDANVLSLGADFLTPEQAEAAVKLFLETPFPGEERHIRRLAKF